jgi:hypothetical protein
MADNSLLLGGRMPMQQQGPKLSTVLQGLQAAYTGQGPQFLQQVQQQEQYQRQSALQDIQMQEALTKSAAQDALRMMNFIRAGDVNQAISLLDDRIDIESRLGVPSNASQNLRSMLRNDLSSALPLLQSTISSGVSLGLITGASPKYVATVDGSPMFQTPIGQYVMGGVTEEGVPAQVPVGGMPSLSERQRKEEWSRAESGFRSNENKLNSEARILAQEYGKIDQLAAQATNPNVSDRARRQAAATLITIVARIASPGVVTDVEFRNFGGFADPNTTIASFISDAVANDEGMDSLLDFITGAVGGNIPPELLTQLRGAIDPLNPDLLDESFSTGVKAIAQGLAQGTATSILSSLADQKTSASAYKPPESTMQSLYGKKLSYSRIGELAFGDQFDPGAYFENPTQYIEAQIAAKAPAGTVTPADSAAIPGQVASGAMTYDMLSDDIKARVTRSDFAAMTDEEKRLFFGAR